MWIYLSHLFRVVSSKFIKVTVVAAVLFIVFGLFLQWNSQGNQPQSTTHIIKMQQAELYRVLDRPEYQTKQGKEVAAVQKIVYCKTAGILCTDNVNDIKKDFPKSIFGFMSSMMTVSYLNPPASGVAYTQQVIADAGFTPKVSAAEGIGFASLRPFLPIWKAFRNMSYLLLVIVIIIIGFMIMFQYKIDPHTVITVENALPRIVIALLVITFSYAIAGFLIDLTYLIILFVFEIFASTKLADFDAKTLQSQYLTANILGMSAIDAGRQGFSIYIQALLSLFQLLPAQMTLLIGVIYEGLSFFIAGRILTTTQPTLSSIAGRVGITLPAKFEAGTAIGTILAIILAAIGGPFFAFLFLAALVLIGILFLYFRIIFLLIGAYIQIIIQVMFAPAFLLLEAIPGQNSFGNWLKTLFGHLMVFPIVIAFLIVIQIIQAISFASSGKVDASFSMPLLYGFDTSLLGTIIAGAFLFAIPDLTKGIVKKIAGESEIKAGPGLLFGGAASLMGSLTTLDTLNKVTNPTTGLPGLRGLRSMIEGKGGSQGGTNNDGDEGGGDSGKGKHGPAEHKAH